MEKVSSSVPTAASRRVRAKLPLLQAPGLHTEQVRRMDSSLHRDSSTSSNILPNTSSNTPLATSRAIGERRRGRVGWACG